MKSYLYSRLSITLLGGFLLHCTLTPNDTPSDVCSGQSERETPCGPDGSWIQTERCVDGRWVELECSDIEPCTDETTRTGNASCGPNDAGRVEEKCVNERWEATVTCIDSDICLNGAEQDGQVSCGLNAAGVLGQSCIDGQWENTIFCAGDDVCLNDQTQAGSECGFNAAGALQQNCTDGQWQETDICVDPDVCLNESSQPGTTVCGLNDEGFYVEECSGGQWQESTVCTGNDICENGETQAGNTPCGTDNAGVLLQECSNGAWQNTVNCLEEPDCTSDLIYSEGFDGADGTNWPAPWEETGSVAEATIQSGRATLRPTPSGYSLARIYHPFSEVDAEVIFDLEFEELSTQGVGFYLRQDGSYLDASVAGGGYAVFVEGFRGFEGIGIWREVDGDEQSLFINQSLTLENASTYRVRFRVFQVDVSTTRLQARIWPASDAEPTVWHVDISDSTPALQNLSGGIAVDSWSELNSNPISNSISVDNIEFSRLCNPLLNTGALETVSEAFQFTEGPVWRPEGTLLFSDIDADTVYQLSPPNTVSVFRNPSNEANGIINNSDGGLLICEHQSRSIGAIDGGGTYQTLVDSYQGQAFNSPNDLALRSDGTLFFSDPAYGLDNPADRELAFNGLFRRAPNGSLVAEWMGSAGSGPNGVLLSPDESTLYMSNSASGTVLAWDVSPDGSLSNMRNFADGLTIPDGMCGDENGNVYVATWGNTIEVFSPQGISWGSIAIPRAATNCTFGGTSGRDLYVTAHEGLYRIELRFAGAQH